MKACVFVQLNSLMAACEEFISTQVEQDNCFGGYRFATSILYRLANVKRNARRLILSEFKPSSFDISPLTILGDSCHLTTGDRRQRAIVDNGRSLKTGDR